MKKSFIILIIALTCFTVNAQDYTQATDYYSHNELTNTCKSINKALQGKDKPEPMAWILK